MSFRKRNIGLTGSSSSSASSEKLSSRAPSDPARPRSTGVFPGVRSSPVDGRPTTSTGTPSLDDLLAGHAGLALGHSVLIEESGTTDYAGILLRYYAAEGVLQGHQVHVVGVTEHWARELPGPVDTNNTGFLAADASKPVDGQKMKIAWRYEQLGEFGTGTPNRRALPLPNRNIHASNLTQPRVTPSVFCHNFDLTKRLTNPPPGAITVLPVSFVDPQRSPFLAIVEGLSQHLESSPPNTIHRLIIPSILSPGLYPLHANHPVHVLRFLRSLRAILSRYSTRLTAMITLPLTLFPRSTGLVRWMEILSDGVLELTPFPYTIEAGPSITTSGTAKTQEERPQGLVKVHRLPVFHDKGGGGIIGDIGNDLAFTISRRKFAIKPFNLPPVEGDNEAQKGETETKTTKVDVDF